MLLFGLAPDLHRDGGRRIAYNDAGAGESLPISNSSDLALGDSPRFVETRCKLSVVETGAFTDLLVVDSDPIADIKLIVDAEKNLKLMTKDRRIYTLAA